MQIALVGFQGSGKSKVFHTSINNSIEHPDESKNVKDRAVIKIPDSRLDNLTRLFNPKKQVNAVIEMLDLPGLGSADGKVRITNEFINHLKNADALIHIVREFKSDAIPHPLETINPVRDIEYFETEFLLNDLSLIEKRLEKIEKDITKAKNEQLQREFPIFKKMRAHLENEKPLRSLALDENEKKTISGYQFLSIKPLIIGLNLDESSRDSAGNIVTELTQRFSQQGFPVIPFYAEFEYELSRLSEEEASVFKEEFGINESTLHRILQSVYSFLGLQSFFTVGEDECRAWTISKGMTAQEAAGTIHTDFYNKFIRAEVVHYHDYLKHGSFAKCKETGTWRLEGKEYTVLDGDILNIRHS